MYKNDLEAFKNWNIFFSVNILVIYYRYELKIENFNYTGCV